MEKIASFTVNHIDLLAGIYVSRRDSIGSCVLTTFDLRFTMPNREPVMDTRTNGMQNRFLYDTCRQT